MQYTSTKCCKKLPCWWEHSPAPAERKTAINEGKFPSTDSRSRRRNGRTVSKRDSRY
ncbi:hypothetical protein ES319_A13G067400v1 [Gossypium barbadense]|uniref:Uncharacterized protein n=1 Tax=Gossypium barbadense TaxID=3634 RepID=A0A5J5SVR7_GOSBA|nr:hypothetical protein ES319_A13G067400v1 [Gossypium barbadense]